MVQQESNSAQTIVSGKGRVIETPQVNQTVIDENNIPDKYILEFITSHHLNSLWDEFVYEKNHPKIPLSPVEVLAMVNLSPEEQEKILKDHE